ncbi:hypothetical protein XELAEV_18009315mg [Xenopus laevis]|uniref:Helix-turn-helix domain-containing protein n=1 Tax=Xenopus laevis TaxID=8355 RepID=A0A974DUJ9_XENLA|nr:hypothetical protein XELAEV_18009315mg [Xenopus laevis]
MNVAYLRCIDDILIIWTDTEQKLIQFHEQFNNYHPTINFKLVHSSSHIHFLDTTIYIKDNTIHTTIYRKPTDKPSYLMYDSFHPDHTKHAIIYSQALRYIQICSDTSERDQNFETLRKDSIDRGYNPRLKALRKIARELQGKLEKDNRLHIIFPDPPLLAFRQPPNLRKLIIRSSLSGDHGTHPCGRKRCKTCPHILSADRVQIPDTIEEYYIHGHYTCSYSNLVYAITCTKCPTRGIYIG